MKQRRKETTEVYHKNEKKKFMQRIRAFAQGVAFAIDAGAAIDVAA